MVYAYHVILSAYGFWLPNDPRGSWSDFIRSWELANLAERSSGKKRRAIQGSEWDAVERLRSKLKYEPVVLNGVQAHAVAMGFAELAQRRDIGILACAILPCHAHLVVLRHRNPIERLIPAFKAAASKKLTETGIHPFDILENGKRPKMWSGGGWAAYLDSIRYVRNAIEYVRRNPEKEGKREQRWSFLKKFTG